MTIKQNIHQGIEVNTNGWARKYVIGHSDLSHATKTAANQNPGNLQVTV